MERDKTECRINQQTNINFSNLDFKQCVFFTDEQYNKNKIHIPQQSLVIEDNIYIPEPLKYNFLKPEITEDIIKSTNFKNLSFPTSAVLL